MRFTIAALIALWVPVRQARADGACPPPTVPRGSICTILEDTVLTQTVEVPSFTHLDCRGHKLLPGATDSGPVELAILIHDASGAKVTNCRVEGFAFGVFLLRSPTPPQAFKDGEILGSYRNRINGNQIIAGVKGITLIGAEDARVEDNVVEYASDNGYGIGVWRSSHRNLVRNNRVVGRADIFGGVPQKDFPGRYLGTSPETALFSGAGLYVAHGATVGLVQFIVKDRLFQFPSDLAGEKNNVVEGNTIILASRAKPLGVRLAARNQWTVVRGNTVEAPPGLGATGVLVGSGNLTTVVFPSRCAGETGRFCHRDLDCNPFPLVEQPDQCVPTVSCVIGSPPGECWYGTAVRGDMRNHDVVIEGNVIGPELVAGIDDASIAGRIAGNRVTRATDAGLVLRGAAVDGARVEGNVLDGNRVGIALNAPLSRPGVVVTRNDIVGSTVRALSAPAGWTAPLELSSDGPGNYWGRTCAEGGFLPLTPGYCTLDGSLACTEDAACGAGVCGTAPADAPNPFISDAHPYGEPVAGSATSLATCQY